MNEKRDSEEPMTERMYDELNHALDEAWPIVGQPMDEEATRERDHAEALSYAADAVAACLDMIVPDGAWPCTGEVHHMLAQVLRHPEVLL